MKSSADKSNLISKEKLENLSKIRIIKKNLVHVQGFPKSIAKISTLISYEYFGQYGKIIKTKIVNKINPDNNKKAYSAYITYSNEREAAFAILCVDSLLIKGKIIRAFFGTTKYCSYFLDNNICPVPDCLFLHQLITDKNIIIDNNTVFSYNEHLDLAKKIIQFSNPITKFLILKMKKEKKNVLPFMDFIFLNEAEKEKYFGLGKFSYVPSNIETQSNKSLKECIEQKPLYIYNNIANNKNNITNNYNNYIYQESNNTKNFLKHNNSNKIEGANSSKSFQNQEKKIDEYKQIDPWEL